MHVRLKSGATKAIKPGNLRKLHSSSASQNPEATRVKALFRKYDTNGDGAFDAAEFERFLQALGLGGACLHSFLKKVDTNGDGIIQYEEFVDWILGDGSGGLPPIATPTAGGPGGAG